jgi:carbamoyl-phosphate synthase large subunit
VKEAVFPFIKFPGVDTILGPEMKSTGEVMGVGHTFAEAFVKSQLAAGVRMPKGGKAFLSVRNADKARVVEIGRALTSSASRWWPRAAPPRPSRAAGSRCRPVNKVQEGRPHIVDMLKNREITLIVNTVEEDRRSIQDSWSIRNTALQNRITYYTTLSGARAACAGMRHIEEMRPYDIQSLHETLPS